MSSIKIANGLKTYDIEDEKGNVRGQISFNPSDLNFFQRAEKMQDNISKYIEEIKTIEDTQDTSVIANALANADLKIKTELNELFGNDVCTVVFGNQSCLNIYNGETFIERFLNAIIPIIQKDFKKEMNTIEKYTSQKSK